MLILVQYGHEIEIIANPIAIVRYFIESNYAYANVCHDLAFLYCATLIMCMQMKISISKS